MDFWKDRLPSADAAAWSVTKDAGTNKVLFNKAVYALLGLSCASDRLHAAGVGALRGARLAMPPAGCWPAGGPWRARHSP